MYLKSLSLVMAAAAAAAAAAAGLPGGGAGLLQGRAPQEDRQPRHLRSLVRVEGFGTWCGV